MESFFDLKQLLVTMLRRLKLIISFALIFALLFGAVRLVPLVNQYVSYERNLDAVLEADLLTQEEQPYYYQARLTLILSPIFTELNEYNIIERTSMVGVSYYHLRYNERILQPLVDEFFEEVKADDALQKQKMVECNYRNRSVFNEEYTLVQFYSAFNVEAVNGNMVHLYYSTGSPELSTRIVARAEELLSAYVQENVMPFDYTITVGQMGTWMPEPSSGMRPKTTTTTTNISVGSKPEPSYMVSRTMKGVVWGGLSGLACAVFLVFFINIIGIRVESIQDMKQYPVRILSYCIRPSRKKLWRRVDRWIDRIEGDLTEEIDVAMCSGILIETINSILPEKDGRSILLTGLADEAFVRELTEQLNGSTSSSDHRLSFTCSPSIISCSDTIAKSRTVDGVILVEQAQKSNKSEITMEIDRFEMIGSNILGCVFVK